MPHLRPSTAGSKAGLSERNQQAVAERIAPEHVERATERVTTAVTDGWATAMSDQERQERVAAALAPVMTSLVNASMQSALSDEHLARVRELAKQATLGFQEAIDEVAEQRDRGAIPADKGNVLEAVDRVAEGGGTALYVLGAVVVLLAGLLGLGLAWAALRRRRYEREAARRDAALAAAARLLAREGMPLAEGQAQLADDADGLGEGSADADAELVLATVRRMRSVPQAHAPAK